VLSNDDRSRTFLALAPAAGAESPPFTRLVRAVDASLLRFGLRPFYETPLPHASLLWVLGDAEAALTAALPRLQAAWDAQRVAWHVQVRREGGRA